MWFLRKLFGLEPLLAPEQARSTSPVPQSDVTPGQDGVKRSVGKAAILASSDDGNLPGATCVLLKHRERVEHYLSFPRRKGDPGLWSTYDKYFDKFCEEARPTDKEALTIYMGGLNSIDMNLSNDKSVDSLSRLKQICASYSQRHFSAPSETDDKACQESSIKTDGDSVDKAIDKVVTNAANLSKAWAAATYARCTARLATKTVVDPEYMTLSDDGCAVDGLKGAYPHLEDKRIRALLELKHLTQSGKYSDWEAYTDRCDELMEEAKTMDRRAIQYYYNGLKHTSCIRFKFDPSEEETHTEAYWRLATAAAYCDSVTREDENKLKLLDAEGWKSEKYSARNKGPPASKEVIEQLEEKRDELRANSEYWYDEHRRAPWSALVGSSLHC